MPMPQKKEKLKNFQGATSLGRGHAPRGQLINRELALRFGCTGPILRAAGVGYDIRKAEPYSVYPEFDFEIPTGTTGDALDRYMVRLQEMEQSLRIIEQINTNHQRL